MAWWGSASYAQQVCNATKTQTRTADRFCEITVTGRRYYCRQIAKRLTAIGLAQFLALTLAYSAVGAPEYFNHRKLAETAKTEFIVPGYQRFAETLANLRSAISNLCASPGEAALLSTRDAYRQAIAAWGTIEIISFGPVAHNNRFERIFYWPDRKGRGRRQILQLLRKRDEKVLSPDTLARKSVAVQGLTALETVLFGKPSKPLLTSSDEGYSCRYAISIAKNLAAINISILREWTSKDGFTTLWLNPGQMNSVYLAGSETTLELVKALDHGLEYVRDKRIGPVLGVADKQRRKSRPVLWRSRLSMVLIHANIGGLRDLLFKGGMADAYIESMPDKDVGEAKRASGHMASIKSEFDLTLRMTGELIQNADPFALPDIGGRLIPIGFPLKNIRQNAISEIKLSAALAIGFNASDGD